MRRDGVDKAMNPIVDRATKSLSERQYLAVTAYLRGATKSAAAEAAGYPATSAASVFDSVSVRAALDQIAEQFLRHELVPMALRTAHRILDDEKAPAGVRANLALGVLDRGGFDAKRHDRQAAQEKDPSRKSASELRAEIEALEAALLAKARDVTPVSAPSDSYAIDFE